MRDAWLIVFRRYLLFAAAGHLAWEAAHLPLYALWQTGTPHQIAWFVLRCTGGDLFIALGALMCALLVVNDPAWPARGYRQAAILAVVLGIAVTVFSEWFDTRIAATWAYSDLMPIIPGLEVGLSPVAQWVLVPTAGFAWARGRLQRPCARRSG